MFHIHTYIHIYILKINEYKNKVKTIIDGKNAKEVKYIEDKLIESNKRLAKREEDYNISLKNIVKMFKIFY